jgi:hypothetical protein
VSSTQIVESYLRGEISRRSLVRRLVAAGVSFGAAVSYAELLRPEWAFAAENCVPDHYDIYDIYPDCDPPPAQEEEKQETVKQEPTPPPGPQPDTTKPGAGMTVSKLGLATLLVTGRLPVRFTLTEAGSVTVKATMALPGGAGVAESSRRILVARGSATFARPGAKRVVLRLTRAGRKALRSRRRATLRLEARAVDRAGNARTRALTLKLR